MDFKIDLGVLGRIISMHGRRVLQLGSIHNKHSKWGVSGLRRGVEIIWDRGCPYRPYIWIRFTERKKRLV